MKITRFLLGWVCMITLSFPVFSQKVTYSEPLKEDDFRSTEFEIIGKLKAGTPAIDQYADHILVYKNNRNNHKIAVYSPNMDFIGNVDLKFNTDKLLGVNFMSLPDHFIMIYQYQLGDFVYSKGMVLNGNGQVVKGPVSIDSSEVGKKTVDTQIYSVINSDDRGKILIYKINQDKDKNNVFYTFLYDDELNFLRNSRLSLPMTEPNAFLSEFTLSNEGHFFFIKESRRNKNSNIDQASFVIKDPYSDDFKAYPFDLKGNNLEKFKLKIDHKHFKVLMGALYYQNRKNVEGLFVSAYSLADEKFEDIKFEPFNEKLREAAIQKGNPKSAFDNYFIRDFIIRGDGGFLLTTEEYFTSSNYNGWNRYNGMYSPWGVSPFSYPYYYSPYYYSPFSMYGPYGYGNRGQDVTYNYEDIGILSYDSSQQLIWSNFVRKDQQDDRSASFLSYMMVNIGSELLFLFNTPFRRSFILTSVSVNPNGKLSQQPTLRGQDKGYEWMPRYGRQIGPRSIIIPSIYKKYICFAKIDF